MLKILFLIVYLEVKRPEYFIYRPAFGLKDIKTNTPRIAYFCMEYGLHKELPIYAGGLGILAGDYLKAAADLNYPLVGLGILWRQNYTKQLIGEDGYPHDYFPDYDFDFIKDTGVTVDVHVREAVVKCKIHLVDQYGNAPLYLLDTDYPGSRYGWITSKLYGGSEQDRIAQEIVLGIGGVKALRKLGIEVDKYHFNEGHAVLAGVELLREKMEERGMEFKSAVESLRQEVVFTTHTPVEAGNEIHGHDLLSYMKAYNGLNYEQMRFLGGDPFNMTAAGLRMAGIANAVSELHGKTARRMWKDIDTPGPLISITNGVHVPTWQDPRIAEALNKKKDLWRTHLIVKKELLDHVLKMTGNKMDVESLTIGFARRAAPYKRSELIFRNAEIIGPLLEEGKIQLIFSGKAHPDDKLGKSIIIKLVQMDRKYGNSVVFLEDYDMSIALLMVRGCDVWLNTPLRPLEASGTSGMKAALNGVLNVSVKDGWVAEGIVHGKNGWLLDEYIEKVEGEEQQDEQDIKALNKVLTEEVMPLYYGKKSKWEEMMRASIDMCSEKFSSWTMIRNYYEYMYRYSANRRQVEP